MFLQTLNTNKSTCYQSYGGSRCCQCHAAIGSFILTCTHLESVTWEEGTTTEELPSSHIFFVDNCCMRAQVDSCIPRDIVLSSVKNHTETAVESKPANTIPSWFLCQFPSLDSSLDLNSCLPRGWFVTYNPIEPFSSQLAFGQNVYS